MIMQHQKSMHNRPFVYRIHIGHSHIRLISKGKLKKKVFVNIDLIPIVLLVGIQKTRLLYRAICRIITVSCITTQKFQRHP